MLHERLLLPLSNHSLPASSSSPEAPFFTTSAEQWARALGQGASLYSGLPLVLRRGSARVGLRLTPPPGLRCRLSTVPATLSGSESAVLPLGNHRAGIVPRAHCRKVETSGAVLPQRGLPRALGRSSCAAGSAKSQHCNEEPDTFERQNFGGNREIVARATKTIRRRAPRYRRLALDFGPGKPAPPSVSPGPCAFASGA